jgi:hypothetical protein
MEHKCPSLVGERLLSQPTGAEHSWPTAVFAKATTVRPIELVWLLLHRSWPPRGAHCTHLWALPAAFAACTPVARPHGALYAALVGEVTPLPSATASTCVSGVARTCNPQPTWRMSFNNATSTPPHPLLLRMMEARGMQPHASPRMKARLVLILATLARLADPVPPGPRHPTVTVRTQGLPMQ